MALSLSVPACSGSGDDNSNHNHLNNNFNWNGNGNENGNLNDNVNDNTNENINTNQNTNSNNQPVCGNDVTEPPEECDDGNANSDTQPDACRTDCTLPRCGDSVTDTGEACDDGNTTSGDQCSADCLSDESCGNGQVDTVTGEQCDEGAANCDDSAACTCATNCTFPGCGNGVVESYLGEQCDEGAGNCNSAGCTCSTACAVPGDACGYPADGIWFEIDYSGAFTATNPDWTFSPTPGWSGQDWAPQGSTWPEVWDVYNNINVVNDPIGKVAALGWDSTLQVMLGLGGLASYTQATVCVEGRSISATASVIFDVYNPLNNCGTSASMAHDWTVHAVGVDMGTCLISGNDFQAVRVEPSGGSSALGIMRMRVTLHGAVY